MTAAMSRGPTRYLNGLVDERDQRIDLFGDAHGAEFGGDRGADAAGDHEAGQHRAEFAGDAERHDGGTRLSALKREEPR